MRNFADRHRTLSRRIARLVIIAFVLACSAAVRADTSDSKTAYTEALSRERRVRIDLDSRTSDSQAASLLRRIRALVESYERMARQYPASPYMDNALWQGALLASDAFWTFGEPADKLTALQMFSRLADRFPTSSLVKQSATYVNRLKAARPTPTLPKSVATPPRAVVATAAPTMVLPVVTVGTSTPVPEPPAPATLLTAVRRDVLADTVRITLELGREVPFHSDRLGGPPRVFIDFDNTRAVDAIKDATIPFPDDIVKQVRIGRQADSRTRVVMDLTASARHSIYTLYNPYRVVIDFERPSVALASNNSALADVPTTAPDGGEPAPAAPAEDHAPSPATVVAALEQPSSPADEDAAPPRGAVPAAPPVPAPPSANASGRFSLSRQLGLSVSRIVIDPGHGGHDPGAKTRGLTEADLVLDVALRLEKLLQKHDGIDVVLTRRVDTFVPLEERTAIANREKADLFLSIHANASVNTSARGVETYFLNLAPNPDAEVVAARENAASALSMRQLPDIVKAIATNNKIRESHDFASMIQSSLISQVQKTDRSVRNLGVKQAPFMVLLGATMPSVLAEISFITNRQDAALLKTDKHRQRIAEALYAGILRYQQSLKAAPAIAEQ